MREVAFLYLYGIGALLGVPIALFWATMSWRRYKEITHRWWRDRYLIVTLSFTAVAAGVVLTHATRTIGNFQYGLSPILRGPDGVPMAIGLTILLVGFLGMIWLADLEVHPPRWKWTRWSVLVSGIWFLTVVVLHLFVTG